MVPSSVKLTDVRESCSANCPATDSKDMIILKEGVCSVDEILSGKTKKLLTLTSFRKMLGCLAAIAGGN